MKSYQIPGLTNRVYMPFDVPVVVDLVPASVRNVRSNRKRAPSEVTWHTFHETANQNRGANARMHRNWLHGGASGSSVGFNSVSDDQQVIVLTPYDEDTWAAGTAVGNRTSDHHELCVNSDINHNRARDIACSWIAGVIYARGRTVSSTICQHNKWTGKNCPMLIRRLGLWSQMVSKIQFYWNQIDAFVKSGSAPAPSPAPSDVKPGDTMSVTENLNVRRGAGTSFPVLTTLSSGTSVKVGADSEGAFRKTASGYTWLNISYSGGSGWAVADWLRKTASAPAPPPSPSPGKKVTVRFESLFRNTPGFWDTKSNTSNVIGTIASGSTGTLRAGPTKADGIDWYQVEIPGKGTGWIAMTVLQTLDIQ